MSDVVEVRGFEPLGKVKIAPLGDSGAAVILGDIISTEIYGRVRALSEYLEQHPFKGMIEYVPSFSSVAVYYDGLAVLMEHAGKIAPGNENYPFAVVAEILENILRQVKDAAVRQPRIVNIPVCYGGEGGPDLDYVAEHNGLTPQEVIDIHTSADYLVYMLGFAPGFAYLGGLPERIATPRRQTPRVVIPSGTVGIAGDQTGVYPIETPGGWQLIGKTPKALFLPECMPPTLLQAGDIVRFYPITLREFGKWGEEER
ncbi:5-oxoprolinase subunit PxpB [Paenibacillus sp. S150]|uniref:5-oxoprolinase subunit PxpB n=1 Tax=Paenibacillus sp. S150 TaxID=2749826 RepID=UPI001C5849AD|nr:5-oxoprolinase subunit PxpB [Paenibacillus sp. S150]MBW4084567.1 5-oxoprolinase subunit PxpB [Paenibacillus sp. S150]